MEQLIHLVRYEGTFGYIKPWTAVRDELTYSQQFLTPSMIAGIERKIFPELLTKDWGIYKICGHRLKYRAIVEQQEVIQTRGANTKSIKETFRDPKKPEEVKTKTIKVPFRGTAILQRGILLYPSLWLAFKEKEDAQRAFKEHICLARNEDMLFPTEMLTDISKEDFLHDSRFSGFELVFEENNEENNEAFPVGYNRFNNYEMMYGWLRIVGIPVE